jgi:hypothetical protein
MTANVPAPSVAPRRKRGDDIELLVPAPAPASETWAPALLDVLTSRAGTRVSFVRGPETGAHTDGPWAFHCELAADRGALPPAWCGRLTLRLGDGDSELRREEAALRFCSAHGLGVPEAIARVQLGPAEDDGTGLRATHALVVGVPDLVPLPELIRANLRYNNELITGCARAHAALHDLDSRELESSVPVLSIGDELERIDNRRFGARVDWLRANAPRPARRALCHGGYVPFCASGPASDAWEEVGGPGGGLVISNWCGAILAERECDVGHTLVALWMLPSFAKTRADRTMMKMVRNVVTNGYRVGYSEAAPLDLDRLRFWQAFHALHALARLEGAYDASGSPFAAPERAPLPASMAPELDRMFTMQRRR